MDIRIWSKKIVAILRYFHLNPHRVLFGITGDIDNLGVYVAKNGRARAEMLVDTYNRIVGATYYQFINDRPYEFFESHFLPAGEEVFILGTSDTDQSAHVLFKYLTLVNIPSLVSKNSSLQVATTNISFGCSILNNYLNHPLLEELFRSIDNGEVARANNLYVLILERIRIVLAKQLDLKKFADISKEEMVVILLRNLVYTKTLEYKNGTKEFLERVGKKINTNPFLRDLCLQILGDEYGLKDRSYKKILEELDKT